MSNDVKQVSNQDETFGAKLARWIQEPLGSIIAASVAAIGSLGVVISGIWMISLAVY